MHALILLVSMELHVRQTAIAMFVFVLNSIQELTAKHVI